jgi:ABC-type transport system involved in multi-copper enzyme maturation permease subunit
MLKKEFRDMIKPVLAILSILLIVPLLALLKVSLNGAFYLVTIRIYRILRAVNGNIYLLSFLFLFGVLIFCIANMLGFSTFKYEHKDRAFEYLLAFPVSRYRILQYKIFTRLSVILVLVVIYEVLASLFLLELRSVQGSLFFLFDPLFFPIWVLFFFLASFFISLFEQKNWIAVISLIAFISTVVISLAIRSLLSSGYMGTLHGSYLNGIAAALGAFIIMGVLGAAFFPIYKRFDVKSPHIHARRFTLLVLPTLLLLTIAGFVILF